MKRIFALLLCLVLAIGLVACDSGKDKDKDKDNKDKTEQGTTNFYMTYNNVKIELLADANAVIEKLGAPISQSEMGACGDQGTVVKYVYDNIELFVLKNGSKATVDQITLKSDLVKTSEGITVGSSKDDVINAYGEGYAKCDDNEIRYTSGNKNLKFRLRDGFVVGVDYMVLS